MTAFEKAMILMQGSLVAVLAIIAKNIITDQGGVAGDFERVNRIVSNTEEIIALLSETQP